MDWHRSEEYVDAQSKDLFDLLSEQVNVTDHISQLPHTMIRGRQYKDCA